jgi:hypothetical protein
LAIGLGIGIPFAVIIIFAAMSAYLYFRPGKEPLKDV